jgi:dipeptidase E
VGGGNTANLLAVWRAHGLDRILRRAWEEGVVLCGLSAGMNCWFSQSVTDSLGFARLAPLPDGTGLLPGRCCPHYDGAALVFHGERLSEVVSSRPEAAAYQVTRTADGSSAERRVPARYLG